MKQSKISTLLNAMRQLGCLPYVVVAMLVAGLVAWLLFTTKDDHIEMTVSRKIDLTPAQVQSIKDIGQWEFLSITDEELVDTVSHGVFSDDELMRIYSGTLRLGIDLRKAKDGWLTVEGDSIVKAVLPPIELLDNDFIDEANSQAFFESGSWKPADRQTLYDKARRQMLARCLTKDNVAAAEHNAVEQMMRLLRSMGFEHVSVSFEGK